MLGVSIYPDKTSLEEDKAYLKAACSYGYQRVFTSMLQIDIQDPKKSIRRLKESISVANQLGMQVMLDIHPMVFTYINSKEDDLSYFHEMGVHTLRLDSGYNGRTEAMMTHNPYGITIDLNMSNDTGYLNLIRDYHPDYKQLSGSFNFYPQSYTGLSFSTFMTCAKRFREAHLRSAAFITSQHANVSPWPVSEGLCTLEEHRLLPIDVQVRHMKLLNCIDDIFIGNAFASSSELKAVKEIYESSVDYVHVDFYEGISELEKKIVCCMHDYRGDASDYMIRSSHNKQNYAKQSIPAHTCTKSIHKGDILILNDDFGQYKGELQIALKDRKKDARINVVGKIAEEEMILLDQLKPFQCFALQEKSL